MGAYANIPFPKQTDMFDGIIENWLKKKQLEQSGQYQQGELANKKRELDQNQGMIPLKTDLIKSQIDANKSLAENRRDPTKGMGAGGKEQVYFNSLVAKDNPHLMGNADRLKEAADALANGQDTLKDGTKINLSPAARASLDRIAKYGNTAQGLNQQRYGNTLENLIGGAQENAEGAVKYSGLLGKLEGSEEKVESLLGGKGSPDYQKYLNFTRVDVPSIAGEYMRELGVNASDEQKRMYKEVVNPVSWDTNPQMALARWNYFTHIVKNVGKSISQSPSKIQSNLKNGEKREESKHFVYNQSTGKLESK